jgi:hypothetical protein
MPPETASSLTPCFLLAGEGRWTSHLSRVQLTLMGEGATWRWPDGRSVTLRFLEAKSSPLLTGERPLPGVEHLPAARQIGPIGYQAVRIADLWPGIDLRFRTEGGAIKYEFILMPGAEPDQIRLRFDGVDHLWLDGVGNLCFRVGDRELLDEAPIAFQPPSPVFRGLPLEEGEGRRVGVAFALRSTQVFGFTVTSPYDPSRLLVIDPALHQVERQGTR